MMYDARFGHSTVVNKLISKFNAKVHSIDIAGGKVTVMLVARQDHAKIANT